MYRLWQILLPNSDIISEKRDLTLKQIQSLQSAYPHKFNKKKNEEKQQIEKETQNPKKKQPSDTFKTFFSI